MKPGAVYVDHTTTSAALSKELALAAAEAGLDWLDARFRVVKPCDQWPADSHVRRTRGGV